MVTPKEPHTEPEPTDRALLSQIVTKRDEAAFRLLVARHGGLVWCVCRRMLRCHEDREDVFQATFLRLLIHADRERWHETIGGWLHKVAYRLSLDVCAARTGEQPLAAAEEPWTEDQCLAEIQRQDAERALHEAIAQLPRRERQAIVLCYFQHRSQEEAATEMGCSVEAIRSLLKRSRRKLYRRLSCRGLSCSLALVALEQTLAAATPLLPELITKTVRIGFSHPVGDSPLQGSSRAEILCQGEVPSMLQNGIANKSLVLTSCTTVFCLSIIGLFSGSYAWDVAHAELLVASRKPDHTNTEMLSTNILPDRGLDSPDEATPEEIEQLIKQLNANAYVEREAAVKRLTEIGTPAIALLNAAIEKNTDRSFRQLVKRILGNIDDRLKLDNWDHFIAGDQDASPPGWKRYCKIVGDSPLSRELFIQMIEYRELLDVYESNPQEATRVLNEISGLAVKKLEQAGLQADADAILKGSSTSYLATLLLIGSDKNISASLRYKQLIPGMFHAANIHFAALEKDDPAHLLRPLLTEYLTSIPAAKGADDLGGEYYLIKTMIDHGLKEESLERTVKNLNRKNRTPAQQGLSLFLLGEFGNEDHLADLEPWLKNSTIVGKGINGKELELRDLALNSSAHLTGENCQDYGFINDFLPYQYGRKIQDQLIAPNDREAAFDKWDAWVKKNPIEKAEPKQ